MTHALESRGPDNVGIYQQGSRAFGHRRLQIIDTSELSHQPMFDPELGLGIVFNGCIYNYPALRQELQQRGYRFFSHGDTEVLLKAYHAWGDDFVQRLNGMFAFAIWDRSSGEVLCGRDRLGIKPFYYTHAQGFFRFASSLPALLKVGDVNTDIDPVALHHYLHFHAVVPAPHTILQGIRKLAPATLLRLYPNGLTRERVYWRPSFLTSPEEKRLGEADWKVWVHQALRKAVDRRMVADVPVGVLLSGGLDSSLIVGLLAEAGQRDLHTFSVGFPSASEEEGNEFRYSDLIAERYGTQHHRITVDHQELLEQLPHCIAAMSEPMVSHDAIGFFLLSREVSKHVKAVQSGQGADEIFAGYHWYPPLTKVSVDEAVATYQRVFFDRDAAEYRDTVNERFYLTHDHSEAFVRQHFAQEGASTAIEKGLRLDTQIMLVDDPVKRVDNMTMAWGVEARVPFLDHELVELAARVPAQFKVAQGGKHILKAVARDVVPHEVIDRPKGYFPVPGLKYIEGPYLDLAKEVLSQNAARQRQLFQTDYLNRLLEDPKAHLTPLRGSKLWQLTLLEYWLQLHHVS
jgi:asparagine synthase (glutamine-hydrolysing)